MASEKGDGRGARGRLGEQAAQALLERRGYRIVDANVRFGSTSGLVGEIDIVAWDGPTLCFVEVKTRRGRVGKVFPGEAITLDKQRQIAQLALAYANRCGLLNEDDVPMRFDVVTVILAPGDSNGDGNGDDANRVCRADLWPGAFLAPDDV